MQFSWSRERFGVSPVLETWCQIMEVMFLMKNIHIELWILKKEREKMNTGKCEQRVHAWRSTWGNFS